MKLDADQVIQTIDKKHFAVQNHEVQQTTLQKTSAAVFKPMVAFISDQLQKHQLAQVNVQVTGTQMVISLEVNVINVPYSSIRPLKRLVTHNGSMVARVYVMMSEPKLNRSKFRIDEVGPADDFVQSPVEDLRKLQAWLKKQFKQLKAYQARLAKVPRATRRAKKTRRSRRRTSRKRRTAYRRRLRK